MQGSILVHQLRKVISLVDLLRDIGLDKQLSLPKVVVLGNQSSGKSSLLQQIVGLDFLPRGSGVVTRRPLELRMNNIPDLKQPYAEFDQVQEGGKKKRFTNFNEVRKTIDDVTEKVCGSKKVIKDIPIVLNIFSATCPNLTIVDLPGITSIPVGEQPKNIYEITKEMALRYIKQPRSIILCVIPANQDLTTSQALKVMMEIDPKGERSIGCLTKIDIMNRGDDATKILKNQQIYLKYGYVGVKNRCQEDVLNNVPVSESLKAEVEYFTKSPIYSTLPRDCFSTESLTKKLTNILYQQIKTSIPEIFEEIKKKRAVSEEQLKKLGPGIANTDGQLVNYAWKSISSFMRIYTNSINGIKNTDYGSDPISSEIREELNNLYKEQYDQSATSEIDDKDIQKAMVNFPGESTIPGFPSIDAFLALLNPLLKKLQNPAYAINNRIHEIMDTQATKIINEIMIKKFPEFNTRFNDLIRKILEKHRKQLENFLNMLLDAEITYLYTNDITYLQGDFALTDKQKKKIQSGKIKDPLIFELRKRIDSYFKLVVRNLRDLVPRQIFNFLVVKCLKQLQFEAFQFTSDVKKLKQWLNQPQEIKNRRKECLKAIKVFDESQKRIRMDPEISKLIRDSKRDSKYYSKIGIKSPEEQQKEAERQFEKLKNQSSKKLNRPAQPQIQPAEPRQQTVQQNIQPKVNNNQQGNYQQSNQQAQGGQSLSRNGSQTSTASNNSNQEPGKLGPSFFNMFGNTATSSQQNTQQSMPKQNYTNPPVLPSANNKNTSNSSNSPNNINNSNKTQNFADFWQASTKQEQSQQQGGKVSPQNAQLPNQQKTQQSKKQASKAASFNQLFGMAPK